MEPIASRPHMPGYGLVGPDEGTGLLPWSWAVERLIRSHNYWLATTWPDGRPHVTPVWGVWQDGALWFSCSRASRKARNLQSDPRVVATTSDAAEPVIVEGHAALLQARDLIAAFARSSDTKYATSYGEDFYADPSNACYRIDASTAFGLDGDDFTGSPTRWTFPT